MVQLLTTKNVKYLSGPSGRPADPIGNWSVVGNLPGKAMILVAKDETIIAIPITDVRKVGSYDLNKTIEAIRRVKNLQDLEKEENHGEE